MQDAALLQGVLVLVPSITLEGCLGKVDCRAKRSFSLCSALHASPIRLGISHDSCYNRTEMSTETTIEIASYRLPLVVERVDGSYQATSPALHGLLVLADSLEEVLAPAPGVARALLEAMQAKGVTPPLPLEQVQFPTQVEILVPA